jgi:FMN phosphatase YigB (HAD superfamily)
MGIESYFEFVVGFEDTKTLKETGLPLRKALQLLKKESPDLANVNILVVGDSVERDILPAKRLGFKTALCKYGQPINEQGTADYELQEIDDIAGII